ncbi:M20/M25/M40 family metallo-hydrolase [Borrelia miyamotoi]|nr:M20/M25/M40 family metallo-hydrolase [Borrelia miyamotoi]
MTHIDIVDAGNIFNWHIDSFKLSSKDSKVYARGVLDDKGSLMAFSLWF